jgi:hypothetical protein
MRPDRERRPAKKPRAEAAAGAWTRIPLPPLPALHPAIHPAPGDAPPSANPAAASPLPVPGRTGAPGAATLDALVDAIEMDHTATLLYRAVLGCSAVTAAAPAAPGSQTKPDGGQTDVTIPRG